MDSPVSNTIANIAGRGVGALAALTTLGQGGGLANYMFQRQRQLADPSIRATFAGSPFAAGMFQVGGENVAPGAMPVAAPSDFMQAGRAVAGPDTAWLPHLAPLAPEVLAKVRGAQGVVAGLESTDPLVQSQAKLVAGIPLTSGELVGAVGNARELQRMAGPGSQVQLDLPGGKIAVGSPYLQGSYATQGQAAAAAAARGGVVVPDPQGGYQVAPLAPGEYTNPAEAAAAAAASGKAVVPTTRGTFMLESREKPLPPADTVHPPATRSEPTPPPPAPKPAAQPLPASGAVAPPGPAPAPRGVASPADMPRAAPPPPPPPPKPAAAPAPAPEPAATAAPSPAPAVQPIAPVSREISDADAARIIQPPAPAPATGGPPPAIAYAPPAWAEPAAPFVTVPDMPLPPTVPPPLTMPPPPPAAPGVVQPPVDPQTRFPLQSFSRTSQAGTDTYAAPGGGSPEQVLRMREVGISDPHLATPEQIRAYNKRDIEVNAAQKTTDADIARLRRGTSAGENDTTTAYIYYLDSLNKFYEAFKTPEERAAYFTPGVRGMKELAAHVGFSSPVYEKFRGLLAPIAALDTQKGEALPRDLAVLKPVAPTGEEPNAAAFEQHLQQFGDTLRLQLAVRSAFQQLPVGDQNARTHDALVRGFVQQRAAAREAALAPKMPEVLYNGPMPRGP